MLKLKIEVSYEDIGANGARNLAAALAEMPQLLVLEIHLTENSIAKEGAASIAQGFSTLKNLT